ncbi:sugar transporter [Colletotrichum sojae]|uniref:Sugar transporter n=1 Tax=Colletotrichum sojae TaxID=2175907 RepID=A0A8H6MS71_9PEZI|nr:sugar transporter [Colletotrichum sojae]
MASFDIQYPRVWLWCAFAALGAFLYGYDGVYFNGVSTLDAFLHRFGRQSADGVWSIPPTTLSVMTSMMNVGELVGSLGAAPLNDVLGRKGMWLVGSAFTIVGVVLQLVAELTALLTAGRHVLGVGVGGFSVTSPLYMGEVAPARLRAPLLMCWQLTLSVSQIVAAGINRAMASEPATPFSFRFPIGFQLLFPVLVLAGLPFVPESPRWLAARGKTDRAARSLRRLLPGRGRDRDRDRDREHPDPAPGIIASLQHHMNTESHLHLDGGWTQLVTDRVERRKVVFSAGALVSQQVNGIQWFYYFGTVFARDIGLQDPFLVTLIVFSIQVVVVAAAVVVADRLPRRPLLLATTGIMTVSIFIVGCLGIPNPEVQSRAIGRVIISFIILEIVAFSFAWGPLGWTIASEMAVGRNRNKIYAVAVAAFWVTVWATVFTLPYLYYSAGLGPRTGFVYTGLCLVTWSYVYFCVGEVRGRTFEEIEGFFRDGIPAKHWAKQPRAIQAEEADEAINMDIKG